MYLYKNYIYLYTNYIHRVQTIYIIIYIYIIYKNHYIQTIYIMYLYTNYMYLYTNYIVCLPNKSSSAIRMELLSRLSWAEGWEMHTEFEWAV